VTASVGNDASAGRKAGRDASGAIDIDHEWIAGEACGASCGWTRISDNLAEIIIIRTRTVPGERELARCLKNPSDAALPSFVSVFLLEGRSSVVVGGVDSQA